MRCWIVILMFTLIASDTLGQFDKSFQYIKGLPTEEAYDTFVDSKGFVWVGHALGISRFDGISFTSFTSDDQTASGITRIIEDNHGRIWCHNFNGQVFYIENEEMHLYDQYLSKDEKTFPDLVFKDSILYITSLKGLFVCNTNSMKGRYIHAAANLGGIQNMCLSHNSIIIYNNIKAYKYKILSTASSVQAPLVYEIPLVDLKGNVISSNKRSFTLMSNISGDTLFAIDKTNSIILTLIEKNDTLKIVNRQAAPGFINTIVKYNDSIWVNTKKFTYYIYGKVIFPGTNISKIIKDKHNNVWVSSLDNGLLANSAYNGWQIKSSSLSDLKNNDFVRSITNIGQYNIYGTQKGTLMVYKDNKLVTKISFPPKAGSIEHVFLLPNNKLLVAPSIGLFIVNFQNGSLFQVSEYKTLKSFSFNEHSLFFAYSQGLAKFDLTAKFKKYIYTANENNKDEQLLLKEFSDSISIKLKFIKDVRCYFVQTDELTNNIYAYFKDGLKVLKGDQLFPIEFNKKSINTNDLTFSYNKLFIATLNNGLLIKVGSDFQQIDVTKGLMSNTIIKMKIFGNKLILVESEFLQVWDIGLEKIIFTLPLPKSLSGGASEISFSNGVINLEHDLNIFSFNTSSLVNQYPDLYLNSVFNSEKKLLTNDRNGVQLKYTENNIRFSLSSPTFIFPESIHLFYRLKGPNSMQSWIQLNGTSQTISFQALEPGNYQFEAYALNFANIKSKNEVQFSFTVLRPFYQQFWFVGILFCLIALTVFLFILRLFRSRERKNSIIVQNISLQNELRKSQLKSILAQMNPHFIFNAMNTIQSFVFKNDKLGVSDYLGKFSQLIRKILHSSNLELIPLDQEIEILKLYIDLERARLNNDFELKFIVNPDLLSDENFIPPMLIQSYLENAFKHGLFHKSGKKCLTVNIDFDNINNNYVCIQIEDNGVGRIKSREINNKSNSEHKSFATSALDRRIQLINQTLVNKISVVIQDLPGNSGTIVTIKLPIIKSKV